MLCDIAETRPPAHRDVAGVGFYSTGKDLQQSGLPRSVGTDQSDTIAFRNSKGNVLKERRDAVGPGNLLRVNQWRHSFTIRHPIAGSYLSCIRILDPLSNKTSILLPSLMAVATPRPNIGCSRTSPSSYFSFGEYVFATAELFAFKSD